MFATFVRFGEPTRVACFGAETVSCPRCARLVAHAVLVDTDAGDDGAFVLASTGELFDLDARCQAITGVHDCSVNPPIDHTR